MCAELGSDSGAGIWCLDLAARKGKRAATKVQKQAPTKLFQKLQTWAGGSKPKGFSDERNLDCSPLYCKTDRTNEASYKLGHLVNV